MYSILSGMARPVEESVYIVAFCILSGMHPYRMQFFGVTFISTERCNPNGLRWDALWIVIKNIFKACPCAGKRKKQLLELARARANMKNDFWSLPAHGQA
jgi:hypothetical protein